MLSRRGHGILDYIIGLALVISPLVFRFNTSGAEANTPIILGFALLVYSMFTNYELGLFKLLPFKIHLGLDVVGGIFLAASPWLLQFSDHVWIPHLVIGLVEIGAAMITSTTETEHHTGIPGAPAHS